MDTPLFYLCLSLSVLLIVIIKQRRNHCHQHKKLPPSPPRLPIIGHFHLLKPPVHLALTNLAKKYGPIYLLHMGSRPTLVLSSRELIEECFTKNDITFSNRPLLPSRRVSQYNFNTLGAPYGNHWRNSRRFTALEIFSAKRLQLSSEIRAEEIRLVIKHLYKRFEVVNVKSLFYMVDYNIMMKILAGKRYFEKEELEFENSKGKLDDLRRIFSPFMSFAFGDYIPYLRWLTYYGAERQILKIHGKRDAFLQNLIDQHRNSISDGQSRPIVDVLLKLQESEPEFYTNDVIKGILQAMLLAGTHTTVLTMDTVVSNLIANPEVLRKARDEIDNHVGNSRLISETDLASIPYLHAIINESLRLGFVRILPARESSEDCTVGGYFVPKGTQLLVNAWAVHSDPDVWKEPDRFEPDRFLESEQEKGGFKFIAFGLGRRVCPGEGLGMRVMELTLGTLIQCFDWEVVKSDTLNKKDKEQLLKFMFRPRESLKDVLDQL